MSNLERDRLLSDLEFERLKNRSKETLTRATNDARVRRKLSAWLKNLDDVFYIMQKLPENQLKDVFGKDDIDKLYSIIGEAMKIKNYYPPALGQWREELEKKETEIFKLRHGAFLQQDLLGPISYSKPLIELIQQGKKWTEEDLLKELHMDPKDSDVMQIVTRQLERLAKFGLVRKEADGWMWAEQIKIFPALEEMHSCTPPSRSACAKHMRQKIPSPQPAPTSRESKASPSTNARQ